ncbi:MAG TPA: LysM peptidoglycan-binding domain-containing protein, partial [Actinomycetes bacterium]|nr:LysM peptidoglycan-binding domain-containing protein [Actinomycetes bacterium]
PTTQEVAGYVDLVADSNRDRLRSGDPDLIFPGETIILPPVPAPAEPTSGADRNRHDVAEGESLWSIAQDQLAKAMASGGGAEEPTDSEVADYWAKLKKANQDRLRDPDLIFPGEEIILPPVD